MTEIPNEKWHRIKHHIRSLLYGVYMPPVISISFRPSVINQYMTDASRPSLVALQDRLATYHEIVKLRITLTRRALQRAHPLFDFLRYCRGMRGFP